MTSLEKTSLTFFLKISAIPDLFFFIFVFSVIQLVDKILPMSGLNLRSLVLEATALPTEPPTLPQRQTSLNLT